MQFSLDSVAGLPFGDLPATADSAGAPGNAVAGAFDALVDVLARDLEPDPGSQSSGTDVAGEANDALLWISVESEALDREHTLPGSHPDGLVEFEAEFEPEVEEGVEVTADGLARELRTDVPASLTPGLEAAADTSAPEPVVEATVERESGEPSGESANSGSTPTGLATGPVTGPLSPPFGSEESLSDAPPVEAHTPDAPADSAGSTGPERAPRPTDSLDVPSATDVELDAELVTDAAPVDRVAPDAESAAAGPVGTSDAQPIGEGQIEREAAGRTPEHQPVSEPRWTEAAAATVEAPERAEDPEAAAQPGQPTEGRPAPDALPSSDEAHPVDTGTGLLGSPAAPVDNEAGGREALPVVDGPGQRGLPSAGRPRSPAQPIPSPDHDVVVSEPPNAFGPGRESADAESARTNAAREGAVFPPGTRLDPVATRSESPAPEADMDETAPAPRHVAPPRPGSAALPTTWTAPVGPAETIIWDDSFGSPNSARTMTAADLEARLIRPSAADGSGSPSSVQPAPTPVSVPAAPPLPGSGSSANIATPADVSRAFAELEQASAANANQLVRSLRLLTTNGGGEAHIRLEPNHFGDVDISLRVRAGQVEAQLRAESGIVRDWLQANHAVLRQALTEHGLTLDRIEVSEPLAESRRYEQEEQSRREEQSPEERRPRRRQLPDNATFEVVA